MAVKFTQLQCKEVICVKTGQRLGFVTDVQVDMSDGRISAILVPCPAKLLGLGSRREDYLIPWSAICRIGPDIILVDTRPEDCRCPRPRAGLPF